MLILMLALATATPTRADIPLIEKAVRQKLRDPDSAKFEWPNGFVRYTPANGVQAWGTCGTVNARNGYGGYTGKMAVLGTITNGVADAAIDVPGIGATPVRRTCAALGIPVD